MNKKLKEKIAESLSAVLPITAIVVALWVTITPMSPALMMMFLAGACLLILGMGFFTLGADMAMMPIGEQVGGAAGKIQAAAGDHGNMLHDRRHHHHCGA